MKKILIASILLCSLVATPAMAQSAITNNAAYNTMSTPEKIAFLYGMIAQLQIILELRAEADADSDSSSRDAVNRADVDVETLSATDIEENEAELRAEVDLDGEDEALIWFEYGEDDDDLGDRTTKRRIDDDDGDTVRFTEQIEDLDDDERHYYRAVVEDKDGDRSYGDIRNFRTDDEDEENHDNNNNDDDSSSESSGDFELTVSDTTIEEGDEVEVDWEIPSDDEGSQNWIGLYEVDASNSGFESWQYIDDDNSGTITFTIDDEGEYEFRLFLNNSYDDEVTSSEVEVE